MRKSFCSLISFLLFSLLACGAASAHWYVAPTGNDAVSYTHLTLPTTSRV